MKALRQVQTLSILENYTCNTHNNDCKFSSQRSKSAKTIAQKNSIANSQRNKNKHLVNNM